MIYLDNAATTRPSSGVIRAMNSYLISSYGNPSSLHDLGQKAHKDVENAREIIASSIGTSPEEIYFTSGGTESDNWAIKQAVPGTYTATSSIEHHAILNTCHEQEDFTYLADVDEYGTVKTDQLEQFIRQNSTSLVSIMFANNEIGTIQPIKEISEIARSVNATFHTDAVQAYGHIPINVDDYGIDMMSASAHKLNGPKGIGFLYIRKGINVSPLIYGGGQERELRSGTENTLAIVGFGQAVKEAMDSMNERNLYETSLRDYMIKRILTEIPDCHLNGHPINRLPNNVNFSFEGIEGEALVMVLNEAEIYTSAASACSSGKNNPSHVLKAIGLSDELANGSVRLTLSYENTREEIDYAVDKLKDAVAWLR